MSVYLAPALHVRRYDSGDLFDTLERSLGLIWESACTPGDFGARSGAGPRAMTRRNSAANYSTSRRSGSTASAQTAASQLVDGGDARCDGQDPGSAP